MASKASGPIPRVGRESASPLQSGGPAQPAPPPETVKTASAPSRPRPMAGRASGAALIQEKKPLPEGLLFALLIGAFVLIGILFAGRFRDLVQTWATDDNYSHGFLIPLVSAFLAWRVARQQGWPEQGSPRAGLAWLAAGGLLHLCAEALWLPPVDFFALTVVLYGLALAFGGRAWAFGFVFPIGFLFFMFPLPVGLTNALGIWLQGVVSALATDALQLVIPAHRQGYFIYLPGEQLEVGDACSGLRQVVAFAALALLVAYLAKRSWWARGLLVAAALPVAIAANLLRVLVMAGALRFLGPAAIGGAYHTMWGLLTMSAGLLLLLGVSRWLGWVVQESPAPADGPKPATESPGRVAILAPSLYPALGCLGAALFIQTALRIHVAGDVVPEPPTLRRPLDGFPGALEGWSALPSAAGPESAREVSPAFRAYYDGASDRLDRVYAYRGDDASTGTVCKLWMIHYRDGQDRNHHPLVCYQAAGIAEDPAGNQVLSLPGRPAPVQRFAFATGDTPTWVYYWHYTFEPPPGPETSLLRLLARRRTQRMPSLTVEVFANAATDTQLSRAADFVRLVDVRLQEHVPEGARMGSDTLPIQILEK